MTMDRRAFLTSGAAGSTAFMMLSAVMAGGRAEARPTRLVLDTDGLIDLPQGFGYRVLSRTGDMMSDGFRTPGYPDGMAAFAAPGGKTVLIRNHELDQNDVALGPVGPGTRSFGDALAYDRMPSGDPLPGGVSSLLYDTRTGRVERSWLSLVGTIDNCAGGPTPWGSWLSCEETEVKAGAVGARDHGYVFEVSADPSGGLLRPEPLKPLGRFEHEAVAVDPRTGIVYLTEDQDDSLLYRFLAHTPGRLAAGGRLQALAIGHGAASVDTRNWGRMPPVIVGQRLRAGWIDLADIDSPADDLRMRGARAGAAVFARGEGMWWGNGEVYFACTSGGANQRGQIWRYRPSARVAGGWLELIIEPNDESALDRCDNLTVAPSGALVICEDGLDDQHIRFMSRDGALTTFARNAHPERSEFCGACFSPDGSTMFVNIQRPGITLAITGPFGTL